MGGGSMVWRHDRSFLPVSNWLGNEEFTVIRWGCTATLPTTGATSPRYMQPASGIHEVNNKVGFLQKLSLLDNQKGLLPVVELGRVRSNGLTVSPVLGDTTSTQMGTFASVANLSRTESITQAHSDQWVVRPPTHSQGRNLRVVDTTALTRMMRQGTSQGYARPLVNKSAEYRVFVMNGKVVNVVSKTPSNPSDVAWNVAQGGRFDNVRWGDWPINVVDLACRISHHTGLNLTGIDIMVDEDGEAWFIEANSAPTLPFNSDGSYTYRQKCVAKGFHYSLTESNDPFPYQQGETWRDYIHPAIYQGELSV